jgi:hypothetical protein
MVFGTSITYDHVLSIFSQPDLFIDIPFLEAEYNGDELTLHRSDLEEVLAIAEVLLAAHAPLFFNSDAALLASTGYRVTALAPYQGSRSLSSETLAVLLLDTTLGLSIWELLETMCADDDEAMKLAMTTIALVHEAGSLDVTIHNQVMFRQDSPRLTLGDISAPVSLANCG